MTPEGFVKIIDFGISMVLVNEHGLHKDLCKYGFQGTSTCASMNTLKGWNHSRRDDLESLVYSIMYIIDRENVPWVNIASKENKEILKSKEEFYSLTPT